MGQTVAAAVPARLSAAAASASSSLRFLGLLKQPTDSDQNPENPNPSLNWPLELDEAPHGGDSGGRRRPFVPERRGLSAALGDDGGGGRGAPVRRLTAARVPTPVLEGVLRLRQSAAPVVVPAWPERLRIGKWGEEGEEEREEEEEEEGMVPPHVMVGRAHVPRFSVVEGMGRTLKGRDLRRVRNAVLARTGFLD